MTDVDSEPISSGASSDIQAEYKGSFTYVPEEAFADGANTPERKAVDFLTPIIQKNSAEDNKVDTSAVTDEQLLQEIIKTRLAITNPEETRLPFEDKIFNDIVSSTDFADHAVVDIKKALDYLERETRRRLYERPKKVESTDKDKVAERVKTSGPTGRRMELVGKIPVRNIVRATVQDVASGLTTRSGRLVQEGDVIRAEMISGKDYSDLALGVIEQAVKNVELTPDSLQHLMSQIPDDQYPNVRVIMRGLQDRFVSSGRPFTFENLQNEINLSLYSERDSKGKWNSPRGTESRQWRLMLRAGLNHYFYDNLTKALAVSRMEPDELDQELRGADPTIREFYSEITKLKTDPVSFEKAYISAIDQSTHPDSKKDQLKRTIKRLIADPTNATKEYMSILRNALVGADWRGRVNNAENAQKVEQLGYRIRDEASQRTKTELADVESEVPATAVVAPAVASTPVPTPTPDILTSALDPDLDALSAELHPAPVSILGDNDDLDLPPAPVTAGVVPPPLPPKRFDNIEFGVASIKHADVSTVDRIGRSKTPTTELIEVSEARNVELARGLASATKEKWNRSFWSGVRTIPEKFWKDTVGHFATHVKEKKYASRLYSMAGLNVARLPVDFVTQLQEAAHQEIEVDQLAGKSKVARFGYRAKEAVRSAMFMETPEQAKSREMLRQIRVAVLSGDLTGHTAQEYPELIDRYRAILNGDYDQSAQLAHKLTSEFADDYLLSHTAGERKDVDARDLPDELKHRIMTEVIEPLVQAGLMAKITATTETPGFAKATLFAQERMKSIFSSKEFAEFRDSLPDDVKENVFRNSLSWGTDLIPMLREVVIPQIVEQSAEAEAHGNLDLYTQQVLGEISSGLKVRLGMVREGIRGTAKESWFERRITRQLTQERVNEMYDKVRSGGILGFMVANEATQRTVMDKVKALGGVVLNREVGALAGGAVAYGLTSGIRVFGTAINPAVGLATVGVLGARAEQIRFRQEYQQFMLETEQGYHNPAETHERARRRQKMEQVALVQRETQPILREMNTIFGAVEARPTHELTDDEAKKLLGFVIDTGARFRIEERIGYSLHKGQTPESSPQEKVALEIDSARARVLLKRHFADGSQHLTDLQTLLAMDSGLTFENILDATTNTQVKFLEEGIGREAEITALVDDGILQADMEKMSVRARERAFTKMIMRRMVKAGAMREVVVGTLHHAIRIFSDTGIHSVEAKQACETVRSMSRSQLHEAVERSGLGEKVAKVLEPVTVTESYEEVLRGSVEEKLGAGSAPDGIMDVQVPEGYTLMYADSSNLLILQNDATYEQFNFNVTTDSNGGILSVKPEITDASAHHFTVDQSTFQPTKIVEDTTTTPGTAPSTGGTGVEGPSVVESGAGIPDTVVAGSAEEKAYRIAEMIKSPPQEAMVDVPRPEGVYFHANWRDMGLNAGHELEGHYPGDGTVTFSGRFDYGLIDSHRAGVGPRLDGELEHLLNINGTSLEPDDMFLAIKLADAKGTSMMFPVGHDGVVHLPDALIDKSTGKPDESVIKYLGFVIAEKADGSGIVSASDNPQPDQLAGTVWHYVSSLSHAKDTLPEVPEITGSGEGVTGEVVQSGSTVTPGNLSFIEHNTTTTVGEASSSVDGVPEGAPLLQTASEITARVVCSKPGFGLLKGADYLVTAGILSAYYRNPLERAETSQNAQPARPRIVTQTDFGAPVGGASAPRTPPSTPSPSTPPGPPPRSRWAPPLPSPAPSEPVATSEVQPPLYPSRATGLQENLDKLTEIIRITPSEVADKAGKWDGIFQARMNDEHIDEEKNVRYGTFGSSGEDALFVDVDNGVFAIADGMGGQRLPTDIPSEVSKQVIQVLLGISPQSGLAQFIHEYNSAPDKDVFFTEYITERIKHDSFADKRSWFSILKRLGRPVVEVDALGTKGVSIGGKIYRETDDNLALVGGATAVIAHRDKNNSNRYTVNHLGDTAVFVVDTNGEIVESHGLTTVNETAGIVLRMNSKNEPVYTIPDIQTFDITLQPGQTLVLSSDFLEGQNNNQDVQDFIQLLRSGQKIDLAKFIHAPGHKEDDATFIAIEYSVDEAMTASPIPTPPPTSTPVTPSLTPTTVENATPISGPEIAYMATFNSRLTDLLQAIEKNQLNGLSTQGLEFLAQKIKESGATIPQSSPVIQAISDLKKKNYDDLSDIEKEILALYDKAYKEDPATIAPLSGDEERSIIDRIETVARKVGGALIDPDTLSENDNLNELFRLARDTAFMALLSRARLAGKLQSTSTQRLIDFLEARLNRISPTTNDTALAEKRTLLQTLVDGFKSAISA